MPDIAYTELFIGLAVGAAAMLAVVLFLLWVMVSMGRVWGARGAKRTGVAWGYVDSELSRILGIQTHGYTEERSRLKRQLQELLYEVANKAAKEGTGRNV